MITDPGDVDYFSEGDWIFPSGFLHENAEMEGRRADPGPGLPGQPGLPAAAACGGPGFLHGLQDAAASAERAVAAPEPGTQHPHHLPGASSSPRSSACRWASFAALTASSRANCRSRSLSSSATCRRRRSARCAWPSSASTTRRRSPSSSSAPFSSRCSSSPTACARSIPRSSRRRRRSGASGWKLVRRVVIPASITDIYTDMRILLGWAWTYLIVAEVVGTMSGITLFINQQARYRNFDNVYAAIAMIGIIGLFSDSSLPGSALSFSPGSAATAPARRNPSPRPRALPPAGSGRMISNPS